MNAYVDSSVLLRIVLGEPEPLPSWPHIDRAVSSEMIRLECLRTLDQARVRLHIPDVEVARVRASILEAIDGLDLVALGADVLERAAEPFPVLMGSLDALHLATAILVRDRFDALAFVTHDRELAIGARSMGFEIDGVEI